MGAWHWNECKWDTEIFDLSVFEMRNYNLSEALVNRLWIGQPKFKFETALRRHKMTANVLPWPLPRHWALVAPIRIFAVPMMEKTKICKLFMSEFYCSNTAAFEQSEYFAGK